MKLPRPFTICDLRFAINKKSPAATAPPRDAAVNRQLSIVNRQSASGMALVITLILLSVTLIMAVAFLAMSRRERSAVTTATDTATARLAADSALAAVQAEIIANVLVTNTGDYDYHLLSSTNFLPAGYNQFTISNFFPRPIVMMTNLTLLTNESRFYLDLNRNGKDDPGSVFLAGDPEWIGVLERPDLPPSANNKFLARYAFFALPAGNALDLNYIHNQTRDASLTVLNDGFFRNEGVGSWELNLASFLVDLNTNRWNPAVNLYNYQRPDFGNRGIAFEDALSLLSYRYNYNYLTLAPSFLAANLFNVGIDGYPFGKLMSSTILPAPENPASPAVTNWAGSDSTNRFYALPSELYDPAKSSSGFTGRLLAAGTNATAYDRYTFYRMLDQISTDSTADDVRMNLNYRNISNGVVIAGLETNLIPWTALDFFTNAANRLLTNYAASWLAANSNLYVATFGTNFGVTHIPVLVSNKFVYSPAVHRLLQLAANIYDATTTNFFPSVFRPVFSRTNNDVYITGYSEVSALTSFTSGMAPLDAPLAVTDTNLTLGAAVNAAKGNVYDVPWIIGAKKGFPSFNQFSMRNDATITRKIQLSKASLTTTPDKFTTSQMYVFSINHSLGWSFWNSYSNKYTNSVTMVVRDNFYEVLTNDVTPYSPPFPLTAPNLVQVSKQIEISNVISGWSGMGITDWQSSTLPLALVNPVVKELTNLSSFAVVTTNFYLWPDTPLYTNSAVYRFPGYPNNFNVQTFDTNGTNWQVTGAYGLTPPLPSFGLVATNQLQVFLLDGSHVIDYVHMILPMTNFILTATNIAFDRFPAADYGLGGLTDRDSIFSQTGQKVNIWSTNANTANFKGYPAPAQPMSSGIFNQIMVSIGRATPLGYGQFYWPDSSRAQEQAKFLGFFDAGRYEYPVGSKNLYLNTNLTVQAPYTAVRTVYNYSHWQANDPLVHYLASDLYCAGTNLAGLRFTNGIFVGISQPEISAFTNRFSPWGLQAALAFINTNVEHNGYNLQYKDPGVWRSDNWDFPSGKFPTPGWLGRVHRGTPWQTVYLKASDVVTNLNGFNGTNTWAQWTGDTQSVSNQYYDSINSLPVMDHYLVDLFTTKINDNARHGVLPINVGSGGTNWDRGLAAWSAVFSGVVVLSNSITTPVYTNISPAGADGLNSPVGLMVSNINFVRANIVNPDGTVGVFEHIGDILRAPLLTEQSPFLNRLQDTNSLSDVLYEWVPQQVMGLLRIAPLPRYVVYCYGQALRPAPNSVNLAAGANFGLVTNYQVVAESAARAVIRVDKSVIMNTNIITGALTATGTNYSTTIESYNVLGPD